MTSNTWCEISTDALIHNVDLFRNLAGDTSDILAVVKANAYGHGLLGVAQTIRDRVDMLGVHTAEEAAALIGAGITQPILIMGFVNREQIRDLPEGKIHLTVSAMDVLRWIHESGRNFPIHLKVETGTNRQGFLVSELPEVIRLVDELGLDLKGLATHFANIEDTTDHSYAYAQIARFREVIRIFDQTFSVPPMIHTACSAATLLFPETYFTMVRIGISLYGCWPSKETFVSWSMGENGKNGIDLKSVLTWKTVVGQIKEVGRGKSVGYGCTWKASRSTRLAVLPIGYSDGYDRKLSNQASVLVRGSRAPVVGRVCMNITMVDVTDIEGVQVSDEVVLLGRQGEESVTAEELASIAGTINYEILSRISGHIPRILK